MLKKPLVAMILCVLIVIASTVISTHVRLDSWCEEVKDGFSAPGGISDQIGAVCTAGSGIIQLADSYGVDVLETDDLCRALRFSTSVNQPDEMFSLYQMLSGGISDLQMALRQKDLSDKDTQLLDSLSSELAAAQSAISADSYNSSVAIFLRKDLGTFSASFARLCGVKLPRQFA